MLKRSSRGRLAVAPSAGHNVVLEAPAWQANAVMNWASS
jgi:hypothetical protein